MNKERFLSGTLQHIAQTLESVAGVEEAEAFFSTVGSKVGRDLKSSHFSQLEEDRCPVKEFETILQDVKSSIGGDFTVVEQDKDQMVLENFSCPFGSQDTGVKSPCMMTANVMGHIAAELRGYAKVNLEKTLAGGSDRCRVALYFRDNAIPGIEYFSDDTI